ncbi:MAG: hypothetical protein IPM32_02350 [Ignavibacteriae bacterium]|nr:hypothetical protein [Ignavibacteriota bacterium]
MKINYSIFIIIVLSTSIFSQNQDKNNIDTLKNKSEQLQDNQLSKQKVDQLLNKLLLDAQNNNKQNEDFKIIPLPPSDSSKSKFSLLPNSKPEDFRVKLLNENIK